MELYISDQITALIGAILLGVALGALYDVVRITRIFVGIRYSGADRVAAFGSTAPGIFRESAATSRFLAFCGLSRRRIAPPRKRRARRITTVRHRRVLAKDVVLWLFVFFGDILYFTVSGAAFAVFIHFSGGEFRFFMLFGLLVGFFCYYLTVGRAVIRISGAIVRSIRIAVSYLIYLTVRPLYLSALIVCGIFFYLFDKIMLISRSVYAIIYVEKFSSYKKACAERQLTEALPCRK